MPRPSPDLMSSERIAVGREAIFAHAEEGEIVRAEPLQELVGFGDLVDRQRWRIGRESLDRFLDAVTHGAPVGDAGADVVQRPGEAVDQLLAIGIGVQAVDVEVNQAFARALCSLGQCFAVEAQQLALVIALHGDDRVSDEGDFDALLGELRHGGIEQEGHVVVENFEHGNLAPVRQHRVGDADIGAACRAPLHVFPGLLRQEGKRGGIVIGEVLNIGVAEQRLGKGPGALARLHVARCIPDQSCPGFVITRHNVLHLPRRPTAAAIISLILECISSSTIALTACAKSSGLEASTAPDDNTTIPERKATLS